MKHFKLKKRERKSQFYVLENRTYLPKPKIALYFFKNVTKTKRYVEIDLVF